MPAKKLTFEDYIENIIKKPAALTKIQRAAKGRGLDRLSLAEINREISTVRKGQGKQ